MILALPVFIPIVTAALCLLAWRAPRVQRLVGLAGALALLAASIALVRQVWATGIVSGQMGGWPAPFGITLVADLFSALMVVMAGVIGTVVISYSIFGMDDRHEAFGYYPLVQVLLMGVCGAFLAGDIFNLYVWFEVMLISSFVLLALGGEGAQMEGALKYVTINLLSSAIFLAAVGLLYGATGTLNMADLALKVRQEPSGLMTSLSMLFLVTFGVKAAIFPLFFWLPASYPTPPVPVSALFAGLLTKVGVYALIRVFTLIFVGDPATRTLIQVLAGFTMVVGVLGAASQNEFRRILSFHIISQVGYMILGLGIGTPPALAGAIFFVIHNIVAKTNLFLISGVSYRLMGTHELRKLGGLYQDAPALSLYFLVSATALAGLPPLSGFVGKFALVKAGLDTGRYALAAVALGTGLLTLFSMTKIWAEAFWRPSRAVSDRPARSTALAAKERYEVRWLQVPIAALAFASILLGVGAGPAFRLTMRAAESLLRPDEYVAAVLGARP